jgi:hypothetical protein
MQSFPTTGESMEHINTTTSAPANLTTSLLNTTEVMTYEADYHYGNYTYPNYEGMSAEHLFYYYLWTYVAPSLFGAITVIGTIGNSLVIFVILSGKVMPTVTNILLLNLAFTDIAFLLICVPFKAHKYAAESWTFGDVVCKVVQYLVYALTYVTIWSLVAVSAIRFLTVVYSNKTANIRTKRNVGVAIALIWLCSLLVNIPAMMAYKEKNPVPGYTYCGMHDHAMHALLVSFFLCAYVLPLLLICAMYVRIMLYLQRAAGSSSVSSTQVRTQGRTAKACKVIIAVVLVFAISWLPFHVQVLVSLYGKLPSGAYYEAFRVLWDCMAYSNSCVNPIIYNYVSNDFRKGFREVICCCRWRGETRPARSDTTRILPTETEMTQMLETKA